MDLRKRLCTTDRFDLSEIIRRHVQRPYESQNLTRYAALYKNIFKTSRKDEYMFLEEYENFSSFNISYKI